MNFILGLALGVILVVGAVLWYVAWLFRNY